MRTEYLEYLLEVNRCGSISAAASKLYLRQSTLSAIIGTLEEELGVKIFQRTRKGVVPTPEGELVLSYAEEMTGKNNELREKLSAKNTVRRLINLVAYPSACSFFGPPLAQSLLGRYPDHSFILHDISINKILSKLSDGVANIAVGADDEDLVPTYQGNNYILEKLFEDYFYLVVSKDSAYAGRRRVSINDLTGEHLVFAHYYPSVNDATIGPVLRQFPRFSVFSTNGVIKKAVMQNNMIALMPGLALYKDIYVEEGYLRCIPLTGFSTKLVNFMLYAPQLDPAEAFVLEEIRRLYASLPARLTWP